MIPNEQAAVLLWLSEDCNGHYMGRPGHKFSEKMYRERVQPLVESGLIDIPDPVLFGDDGMIRSGDIRITLSGYDALIEMLESKMKHPQGMGTTELEW